MKKLLILICIVLTISMDAQSVQDTIDFPFWQQMMFDRNVNYYSTKRAYNLYYSNKPKLPKTGYKAFERWAQRWSSEINADGTFPPADKVHKEIKKFKSNNLTLRSATGNWTSLGPFNSPTPLSSRRGVGRVNAIGFHPTDQNTIYCGAPQGGFWKSINKGMNWTSTSDNFPSLGVSAIMAISATKIIIGTGDRDASDANGVGILISTDGGNTFTPSNTGMAANLTVNKLLKNTTNSNTIVAATDGGIYFSYNQGASWVKKTSNTFDYKDIQYCPNDTSILYATAGGSFYKSTNAGNTWTVVTSGLTGTRNRMVIGVTAINPNIVYLLASTSSTNVMQGFYKSSNQGTNFTLLQDNSINLLGGTIDMQDTRGQGWYDIAIETSPIDSNLVLVGGINIFKSTTGGTTWVPSASWYGESGTPFVHSDIHVFARNPIYPSDLYVGSDGGVDITTNNGTTYAARNNGLVISQFYDFDVSKLSKTRVITGAQDNGTSVTSSNGVWNAEIGGDGMICQISEFDTTKMIGCVQNGEIRSTNDNGINWNDAAGGITETPGPWVTIYSLHPRVNNIMVSIFNNVWLSKNPFATTPTNTDLTTGITAEGSAIRFSNKNDNYIFVGWNNGTLKYSNNITSATPTFNNLTTPPGGTGLQINDIETSYRDTNVLYVAQGTKIYKSINRGVTWTNISSNLPNISMKCIVIDRNTVEGLYVGTAAGVYYKDSNATNWILYNTGLPLNSTITDLEIVYDTLCTSKSKLVASTYGRGLWTGDLYLTEIEPTPDFNIQASACAGLTIPINNSTPNNVNTQYQWTITPSTGVTYVNGTNSSTESPNLQFTNPGIYTIELRTQKYGAGNCSITKNKIINIGNAGNVSVNILTDTFICPGDTVELIANGALNYKWSPNINISDTIGSIVKVTPTVNTNYKVISNINGNCFDTVVVSVKMKPFPNIVSTGTTKVCNASPTTINLTGADSFFWSPSLYLNSLNGTNSSVQITPTANINYTIIGKKANQCNTSISLPIQNLIPATYSFNALKDRTICKGDTSRFVLTSNNLPSTVWYPTTEVAFVSKDSFFVHPTSHTKYYLTTLDTTICPFKDSFTVTVEPIPVVTISGPTGVCQGQGQTLTASGANTYTWTPSTYLNTTTGSSVITSPMTNIIYMVEGSNGTCFSKDTHSITVGTGVPNFKVTGKKIICEGNSTILTASQAMSYVWSPSSLVSNPYGKSVKVSPLVNTTLKVVATSFGCKDSAIIDLKVEKNPTIELSSSDPQAFCEGGKLKLYATKLTGDSSLNYEIYPKYRFTKLSNNSFEVSPISNITYTVIGSSVNGCSSSDSFPITIYPKPILTVSPKIKTIYKGDSVTINATGASLYSWSPSKFLVSDSFSNFIKSKPDSDIVYYLKATSANGCISYDLSIIYVLHDTSTQNSSILNTISDAISIYPNPAHTFLMIDTKESLNAELYNITGAIMFNENIFIGKNKIDLSAFSSGTYVLFLKNKEGEQTIEKIIIDK